MIVLLALLAAAPAARGADGEPSERARPTLGVLAGLFEFTDDTYREAELGVQYRFGDRAGAVVPVVGAMTTSAGAFHLYAGLAIPIQLGPRVVLRLGFAPGYYGRGRSGKDLGLGLEFRSSLEIGWRFEHGWRLGLEAYHVSNGDLGAINPGDGSLVLVLTIPLGPAR